MCIIDIMASHSDIVRAAGEAELVAKRRGVSIHAVRSWIQRDSIPPEHWAGFVDDRITTLEELAAGVKPRGQRAAA